MKPKIAVMFVVSLAVTLMMMAVYAGLVHAQATCRQGYVWREAFPGDYVCVTPATRTQAAYDNSQANARIDPGGAYGPDTCRQGYVWREARPSDHVCVTPATRTQTAADNLQASARVANASPSGDRTYNQPRYLDDRLDWCLTFGANCGRPAAEAFCHRRRFEDVVVYRAEVVGTSARTRTIGSSQVCSGQSFCTAFAYITCTRPIPNSRVFANPTWNEYRLDACLQWATNCGKPAADAFCRAKGFSTSFDSTLDLESGYSSTRVIGTGQICTGPGCTGFQQIICQ
jgi:hypothetical protein